MTWCAPQNWFYISEQNVNLPGSGDKTWSPSDFAQIAFGIQALGEVYSNSFSNSQVQATFPSQFVIFKSFFTI